MIDLMPDARTNQDWLADLRGPDSAAAIADLREIVLRGLRAALTARIRRDLDFVVEDFVQDALIKILDNLDTFRGESKFTTWALKIAIHVAYTELRRRRWQDVSLQELMLGQDGEEYTPAVLTDPDPGPENVALRDSMLGFVGKMIDEELTERQRTAVIAIMINGMPISEAARRMDTNRNALYKLVHDARKRLQKRMVENGISPDEVLATFEN